MTIQIDDMTPVIIGAGQFQMDVLKNLENAPGPIEVAVKAVHAAFEDCGVQSLAEKTDRLTAIRIFADSGPLFPSPFGTSKNMPRSIAQRLGAHPKTAVYSSVGGEQPQLQLFETAKALRSGDSRLAVICGGEAIATMKAAMRQDIVLDWSDAPEDADDQDEGLFPYDKLVHPEELRHGLYAPINFYAMIETARRLDSGLSLEAYRDEMAGLFAPFAKRASENPFSMFKKDKSAKEIAQVSPHNRLMAEPYTKSMVAKDGVNQGAAIIMTTLGQAREWGIDPSKYVYLHGFAKTIEPPLIERPDPSYSPALKLAINSAVQSAGIGQEQISQADLYSCFPIVVRRSKEALQHAPLKSLTLTGGLPFFGGAGNNYTLHGIAEMVSVLRRHPKEFGLVHGNGGFMTKHAVGIYSTRTPKNDLFETDLNLSESFDSSPKVKIETKPSGEAKLVSYCLTYKKGRPDQGIVFLRLLSDGKENEFSHAMARFVGDVSELNTLKKDAKLNVLHSPSGNIARLA